MKVIVFIALTLILFSVGVSAKYITKQNTSGVEIDSYFAHSNGAVSLIISGSVENLDECTSATRVYIPHDIPGKELLVSVSLSAFMSGKRVGFHGSGCGTTPFWGGSIDVPIVDNMWVIK